MSRIASFASAFAYSGFAVGESSADSDASDTLVTTATILDARLTVATVSDVLVSAATASDTLPEHP